GDMDAASPRAIEGLALEILAEATRRATPPSSRQPPWLEQACNLLRDRFRDNVSLTALASVVGVHPVYLASTFRRHYHCTIGEFLRRLRIEFACRQMAATNTPLAEIAGAAGFADQSHFCRTFKRQTGLTPAAYRKSLG